MIFFHLLSQAQARPPTEWVWSNIDIQWLCIKIAAASASATAGVIGGFKLWAMFKEKLWGQKKADAKADFELRMQKIEQDAALAKAVGALNAANIKTLAQNASDTVPPNDIITNRVDELAKP